MDEVNFEKAIKSLSLSGITCKQLQEDLAKLASTMAIAFEEAINVIKLAFSGVIDHFEKEDKLMKWGE